MKTIQHITLEIELGKDYQFSLEETEKLHLFIQGMIKIINEYLCNVLEIHGIRFYQEEQ